MTQFFHVSRSSIAEAIVPSWDERARDFNKYFSPRKPRDHAGEMPDPRICVTPRVWQCLISSPDPALPLYIYSLNCPNAIQVSIDEVKDAGATQEHWVVDKEIVACGGEIDLRLEGVIQEARWRFLIQDWLQQQRKANSDFLAVDEQEDIWLVDKRSNPRVWTLRPELIPEPTEVEPLPLPVWNWDRDS